MNLTDLTTRLHRLDQLARGLAKEVTLWKDCNDPLLYLERKTYISSILDAISGVESARAILAKVLRRMADVGCRMTNDG